MSSINIQSTYIYSFARVKDTRILLKSTRHVLPSLSLSLSLLKILSNLISSIDRCMIQSDQKASDSVKVKAKLIYFKLDAEDVIARESKEALSNTHSGELIVKTILMAACTDRFSKAALILSFFVEVVVLDRLGNPWSLDI